MTRIQGLIVGTASFAAGVIIGMLAAPKSGRELRRELSESVGKLRKEVNESVAKLPHLYDDLKLPRLSSSEVESDLMK